MHEKGTTFVGRPFLCQIGVISCVFKNVSIGIPVLPRHAPVDLVGRGDADSLDDGVAENYGFKAIPHNSKPGERPYLAAVSKKHLWSLSSLSLSTLHRDLDDPIPLFLKQLVRLVDP